MSGRLATNRRTHGIAARLALAVLCALAGGIAATAQPSEPPRAPTNPNDIKNKDVKSPLPADRPGRSTHAKFAVPDPDRKIFADIEDFKPVAPEDKNPGEYAAWCEVVSHAKQFSAADLEAHANRDVTVIELQQARRNLFRTDLVRFDGQLICARRLEAPKHFQDNPESGVKELYEVRLLPVDESPLNPVSVVFTDLPEGLAAVRDLHMSKDKGASDWLMFDEKDGKYPAGKPWASAAGFFFKTMNVPGERANAVVGVPVLIGKSVTVLGGPPAAAGADPTALDPNIWLFKQIKDESEMIRRAPTEAEWPELAAQTRVLLHSHRFAPERLEELAQKDVKFADLFLESRKGFKLKLVRFEGRLISLRKAEANAELKAAGIEQVYEGWLVPTYEPRGNPICVQFIDPLPDVEPAGRVNKWVSFAGFSFKKLKYESAEPDPDHPGKNLYKYAPMLIGRAAIGRPDPDAPNPLTWSSFILWALAGGVALIASAGVLTWYYRGGDRKARRAMENARGGNPFDAPGAASTANGAEPPVRPADGW